MNHPQGRHCPFLLRYSRDVPLTVVTMQQAAHQTPAGLGPRVPSHSKYLPRPQNEVVPKYARLCQHRPCYGRFRAEFGGQLWSKLAEFGPTLAEVGPSMRGTYCWSMFSDVEQTLSTRIRNEVEFGGSLVGPGSSWANSGQGLAEFGPGRANIGRSRAEFGRAWPHPAKHRPESAKIWPIEGQIGRCWWKSPKLEHTWPEFGRIRRVAALLWPTSTRMC